MAEKSRDAFRTISEVADWLDVPTHVLRFWESRFSQIKPVKRAGGRRYYRPSDMRIIGGVKVLLHDQGMTIRGVQKLFREEGLKHVSGYSPGLFGEHVDDDVVDAKPLDAEVLERASQPASAARSTRDAEPDPVEDKMPMVEADADAPVLFRHTKDEDAAPQDKPDLTVVLDPAEADSDAAPHAVPSIPTTPDVPANDPADDDAAHGSGPGIAAQLAARSAAELKSHRETLEEAATRLKALLKKVS